MFRSIGAVALLAGAAVLTAVAAPAATAVAYSGEEAGVQAGLVSPDSPCNGCWHFRYVQAQVTLPDVSGTVDAHAFAGTGFSVRLSNAAESAVLGLSTGSGPGGGSWNAAFNLEARPSGSTIGGCVSTASPAVPAGDTILLDLYYDGHTLSWNAVDKNNGALSFAGHCSDPTAGDQFTQAQIGSEFGITPWDLTPPAMVSGNFRLGTFPDTVVTSRTGIRGSAGSAPWPTQLIDCTSNGHSSGQVRASVPFTWGKYAASPDKVSRSGRNFGTWLPRDPAA